MLTDLNNYVFATGFSAVLQEHLQLLEEGSHETMTGYSCYACKQIMMMDKVGTLSDFIRLGFYEYDFRTYDAASESGYATGSWWDSANNCVDPVWLKRYVYSTLPVAA